MGFLGRSIWLSRNRCVFDSSGSDLSVTTRNVTVLTLPLNGVLRVTMIVIPVAKEPN